MPDFLKAEQLTGTKWSILAIPFGGPLKGGKDLDHEFFSPRTDIKADWFDRRPLIFDHGRDPAIGDEAIGTIDDLVKGQDGWWATAWLNKQARYFTILDGLMRAGKAYGSSATMGHFVKKDPRTGELLVWPLCEETVTPTPINVLSRVVPAKAIDDFSSIGVTVDPSTFADLGRDLPRGGDDPAMVQLRALAQSEAVLARIKANY